MTCEKCGTELEKGDTRYCLTHGEYCVWCATDNKGSCKSEECYVDDSGFNKVPF